MIRGLKKHSSWLLPVATFLLLGTLGVFVRFSEPLQRSLQRLFAGRSGFELSLYPQAIALLLLIIAVAVYVFIDYRQHIEPLKREDPHVRYSPMHHVRVVTLPLVKYRWKNLAYWVVYGAATFWLCALIIAVPMRSLLAATPSVTTLSPTAITTTSATLNGTISSEGGTYTTNRGFQFGSTISYGTTLSESLANPTFSYSTKWGSGGSGNGQFSSPEGLARDSSGNIYVVDSYNSRIQKFSSNGTYITKWGSFGFGSGEFNFPHGIAIDSSDNVYVADSSNNRIQKFTSAGVYLTQWGSGGSGNGQMQGVSDVGIDPSGNVWVADTLNNRIQKFSNTGTYISKFGSSGSGNSQFNTPYGIDIDTAGNVYVADRGNNRIQKFTSGGVYTTQWGSLGSANGQFSNPAAISVDTHGSVYVTDNNNHRIQHFTNTGVFVSKFGSSGSANGQFSYPVAVVNDDSGGLYISDTGNARVQKISLSSATGSFTAAASNLTCGTTYHYRAFATNTDGTSYGSDQTLQTTDCPSIPPTVSSQAATNQTISTAKLNGTIDSVGTSDATSRGFEYGPTNSYGANIAQTGSYTTGAYDDTVSGLSCGTTYHFRAFATNASGTSYGSDMSFATADCPSIPPSVSTGSGQLIKNYNVVLAGSLNAIGSSAVTARGFDFGETTNYGATKYANTAIDTNTLGSFTHSDEINLRCGVTLHYRAWAANAAGVSYGDDATITTTPCTDFSFNVSLNTAGEIKTGDSVSYHVKVKNEGPAPAWAYLRIFLLSGTNFGYSSTSSTAYSCRREGVASGIYGWSQYTNASLLSCGSEYYRDFAVGESFEFDVIGTALGDFVNNQAYLRGVYAYPTAEPTESARLSDALLASKDIFGFSSNNVSTATYTFVAQSPSVQSDTNDNAPLPNENSDTQNSNVIEKVSSGAISQIRDIQDAVVEGLITQAKNLPQGSEVTIPLILVIALIGIAVLYGRQALVEFRFQRNQNKLIKRYKATKLASQNFVELTSHYLTTPITTMQSTIDLLVSLKKIPLRDKPLYYEPITALAEHVKAVIAESESFNVQMHKTSPTELDAIERNPLSRASVWLPIVITGLLGVLINLIFQAANRPPVGIGVLTLQIACFVLGSGLLVYTYNAKVRSRKLKLMSTYQIGLEKELAKRRKDFIHDTAVLLQKDLRKIKTAIKPLTKIPESRTLYAGYEGFSELLDKFRSFDDFTHGDLTKSSTTKVLAAAQAAILAARAKANEKNISIQADISPELTCRLTEPALQQLLDSVIDNAVKFSTADSVVTVLAHEEDNELILSVHDDGIGIKEKLLSQLMAPFSRATDVMRFDYQGIGLNLYLNKVILEQANGAIAIRSKVKAGTTVTMRIPA